jgi:hypothetical protein
LPGPLSREPFTVKVLSCHDGDTCSTLEREILPGRDRIRLANADTPEIDGQCQEEIRRRRWRATTLALWLSARSSRSQRSKPDKYDKRVDAYVRLRTVATWACSDHGRAGAALQRWASRRLVRLDAACMSLLTSKQECIVRHDHLSGMHGRCWIED